MRRTGGEAEICSTFACPALSDRLTRREHLASRHADCVRSAIRLLLDGA